jgi:putative nucleotidyltransferase with HDIG domain
VKQQPQAVQAEPDSRVKTSGTYLRVKATRQASWDQALEMVALNPDQQPRQGKHLLTLLRTSHHLTNVRSLDALLQAILEDAVKSLDAQRGAIVLLDEVTGQLELRAFVAANPAAAKGRLYSKTMTERCFREGESLLCGDVSLDADLLTANSVWRGAMASIACALLRSPRVRLGVLHLDRGPYQEPFSTEEFHLADAIAASVSVGIESAQLVESQRNQFIQTITALARTVEIRDPYTAHHTERVTDYSLMLADQLTMSAAEKQQLKIGTPLHDIGKIGIDDAILRKPGKLTADEFEAMKQHTLKGAAILQSIAALDPVIPIVRHHHERWDGNGYPDKLAADRISKLARVVAVADAFDAMTSNRPYRQAMPLDRAFAELVAKSGTHFDPACVVGFLALRPKIEALLR